MAKYKVLPGAEGVLRRADIKLRQGIYKIDRSIGLPLALVPSPIRELNGPEWVRQLLQVALKIRGNMASYMKITPFKFPNPYPPPPSNVEFLKFAVGSIDISGNSKVQNAIDSGSNFLEFVLPDMGISGSVSSIQQFKDLFISLQLPDVANRFESDESFAHNFVGGPNPIPLQRLTSVAAKFPITNSHFQSVPEFQGDDLATAIAEGRVFYVDHSDMTSLVNGVHYDKIPKYTYSPLAAFAVPRGGGRLYPFAIQCGPTPEGRLIYTPQDGYTWKIAKSCVLVAHNIHHELISHLGLTHFLIEPILLSTRRQFGDMHPIFALLNHHFEGTMLINFAARTNLILPTRSVDRLFGCDLTSAYAYLKQKRLEFSFSKNYLPVRFQRQGTNNADVLQVYPYRDDGLLIWNAVASWMNEFVDCFYPTDDIVVADKELQAWAAEISSQVGGMVRDFGATPGKILTRKDLAEILTMVIFTAGPQHAAVNFPQGPEMSFVAANPMAGFTPEPEGRGHTKEDWLAHLPPIEVGIIAIDILTFLAGVNYTHLGDYHNGQMGSQQNFTEGAVFEASERFRAQLDAIENQIADRNRSRKIPYPFLLPSKIPQSINI